MAHLHEDEAPVETGKLKSLPTSIGSAGVDVIFLARVIYDYKAESVGYLDLQLDEEVFLISSELEEGTPDCLYDKYCYAFKPLNSNPLELDLTKGGWIPPQKVFIIREF